MISRANTYKGQNGTVVKVNTVNCFESYTQKRRKEDMQAPQNYSATPGKLHVHLLRPSRLQQGVGLVDAREPQQAL